MGAEVLIIFVIVGAIAGWLAGQIMKGGGFGLIGDIVVGVIGAFIAAAFGQLSAFRDRRCLIGAIITRPSARASCCSSSG